MNFEPNADTVRLSENIILADADYIDRVAFNLTVNFERMLERRIPKADFATWAVCMALDGGLREGDHQVHLVLIHDKDSQQLENFAPSAFADLNGKAFRDDHLGEFSIQALAVEPVITKDEFMQELVRMVVSHKEVRRLMVVPDSEQGDAWRLCGDALRQASEDLHATLFAMQPMPGGNFRQEMLGFSLLQALGISADELKAQ